jgi:hypothetical protein
MHDRRLLLRTQMVHAATLEIPACREQRGERLRENQRDAALVTLKN